MGRARRFLVYLLAIFWYGKFKAKLGFFQILKSEYIYVGE